MARARALAGIEEDARVQLRFYPAAEEPVRSVRRLFGASSESVEALVRINAALQRPAHARAMAAMREEDASVRAEAQEMTVR